MKAVIFFIIFVLEMSNTSYISALEYSANKIDNTQKTITLSFTGDCTLGSDITLGRGFYEEYERQNSNTAYFFENVLPILRNDDITIVNLEGPLTESNARADKQYSFKGYPEFINILTNGDVQAVNLANNHTLDYSEGGYNDTVNLLKNAGIGYFRMEEDCIIEVKGVKFGFLGYHRFSLGNALKIHVKNGIDSIRSRGAEFVIVTYHWGIEGDNYPNDQQINYGRYAIDNGADLVIGHHPHVMQGIEQYNGKYIAYSLANFCFGGNRNPPDKDTFIFQQQFKFSDDEYLGSDISIIPCSVSSIKERNDFRPTPLNGSEAERVINRIKTYSSSLNTGNVLDGKFKIFNKDEIEQQKVIETVLELDSLLYCIDLLNTIAIPSIIHK